MFCPYLYFAALAALVGGSPTPNKLFPLDSGNPTVDGAPRHSTEDFWFPSGTNMNTIVSGNEEDEEPLLKRDPGRISSCGPKSGWMPIDDHHLHLGSTMWGYRSVVAEFCSRAAWALGGEGEATPTVVSIDGEPHSELVRWQQEKEFIRDDLRGHRVGLKGGQPGYVEFEIHNKRKSGKDYVVNEETCKIALMSIAAPDGECCGGTNKDTKGGTWEMEDNQLTFHAFPKADEGDQNNPHDELRI